MCMQDTRSHSCVFIPYAKGECAQSVSVAQQVVYELLSNTGQKCAANGVETVFRLKCLNY